jgi:hypothetical protein
VPRKGLPWTTDRFVALQRSARQGVMFDVHVEGIAEGDSTPAHAAR